MRGSNIVDLLAKLLNESNYTTVVLGDKFAEDIGFTIPSPYHRSLWSKIGVYLSIDGFKKDPVKAWSFYRRLYEKAVELDNHPVYKSLLNLVEKGFVQAVITTSFDGVLSRKSSLNVIELGGNIRKTRCLSKGHIYDTREVIVKEDYRCPVDGSYLRPNIVFYGEKISGREWVRAIVELSSSELVIVAGLDPLVSPYNRLLLVPRLYSVKTVFVGPPTEMVKPASSIYVEYSPSDIWVKVAGKVL